MLHNALFFCLLFKTRSFPIGILAYFRKTRMKFFGLINEKSSARFCEAVGYNNIDRMKRIQGHVIFVTVLPKKKTLHFQSNAFEPESEGKC